MTVLCFAFGHLLQLTDGSFAVRSLDYPEVEGRGSDGWSAREEFRQALGQCVQTMINQGRLPTLYDSPDDMERSFSKYSKKYLKASDRLPNSSDLALIIPVELASNTADALHKIRATSQETPAAQNASRRPSGNELALPRETGQTDETLKQSERDDSVTAAPHDSHES